MHKPMFVVQIMASTLIICLTAFIATISVTKDMTIFVKYLTEMIAAFAQLLYWCWVGNKVFAEVCLFSVMPINRRYNLMNHQHFSVTRCSASCLRLRMVPNGYGVQKSHIAHHTESTKTHSLSGWTIISNQFSHIHYSIYIVLPTNEMNFSYFPHFF